MLLYWVSYFFFLFFNARNRHDSVENEHYIDRLSIDVHFQLEQCEKTFS